MIDLKQAMSNPAGAFDRPRDVVESKELTREQKIEILRRWRYDALQREVAQEENMQSAGATRLREIVSALNDLGYRADDSHTSTKHGGV
jgi:hypothetical protein